jgi:FeS assembly SUF system protein
MTAKIMNVEKRFRNFDAVKAMEENLTNKVENTLRTIYDPEIPVNIMELGLVYNIEVKEGNLVFITMTLTAPACPVAGDIILEVQSKVKEIDGVADAHVQLTFDPPWNKEMMSEEARLELGFM